MTDRPGTALELALVDYVLRLSSEVSDLPDEQIDLDTAVKLLEDVAALVGFLAPEDRARFLQIGEFLAGASEPARARRIRDEMEAIGLYEDDVPTAE